jgi:hypothetical protein
MIMVMAYYNRGVIKIIMFLAACCIVLTALPRMSPVLYPPVPPPSIEFDCDDSTLLMYEHFKRLGIESKPVVGNLGMNDEDFMDSNHVWLLVESGKNIIAYDWGIPQFDRQHYEGYPINLDTLLVAVTEDKKTTGTLAATSY